MAKIQSPGEHYFANGIQNNKNGYTESCFSYQLYHRITVEDRFDYCEGYTSVLGIALDKSLTDPHFATFLSDHSIKLYTTEQAKYISTLKGHKKPVTKIKYSKINPSILFSSSLDGNIRVWDTRDKENSGQIFYEDSDGPLKPICSFDFNLDETYICGGTELIREDAFLVFWDRRMSGKSVGGYWDTHTDDITQVLYHPYKNYTLVSGSMDGLINVFDLSQPSEDEALIHTHNVGSSVAKLHWKEPKDNDTIEEEKLICLRHDEELQIWNMADAHPYVEFTRESMAKHCDEKITVDYLVDILQDTNNNSYLVSGCRQNNTIQIWSSKDSTLKFWSVIKNIHSDDVRAVVWNPEDKLLITGGDDGTVCICKPSSTLSQSSDYKALSSKKQSSKHSSKPYFKNS